MPATATKCTGGVCLDNPLGENVTPEIFIGKIILAVLGIVGSLALVMFIYGGLTWMTASGNSEKVEKGKNIIIWAVIGLAVIFMSYAMVRFVFTSLGGAT
ncbi:MAG: pilin [Patescibacteria group bacterium]